MKRKEKKTDTSTGFQLIFEKWFAKILAEIGEK